MINSYQLWYEIGRKIQPREIVDRVYPQNNFAQTHLGCRNGWDIYQCFLKNKMGDLKYGFCNKSLRKDETLTSWTQVEHFFNIFIIKIRFSLSNVLIKGESNFDVLIKCSTCVQLVRVSSFQNDLFQNPYFRLSEISEKNWNT